jgi:hypothetical protein
MRVGIAPELVARALYSFINQYNLIHFMYLLTVHHTQYNSTIMEIYTYTNTAEYREVFRRITEQSTHTPENPYDIDEETLDEMNYDENCTTAFLDRVFANTRTSVLFHAMYDLAAAKMISTDREIGLAILCSYDYLAAFYVCYMEYMKSPEEFSEAHPSYVRLMELLG